MHPPLRQSHAMLCIVGIYSMGAMNGAGVAGKGEGGIAGNFDMCL